MRVALLLLVASACQPSPKSNATGSDSARAAVASAAPGVSAAPAPPAAAANAWFVGAWQGAYQASLFRVEVPAGGVKEWKADDGKQASGDGKLSLQASADGSVIGTASGVLGELSLVGQVDHDRAALILASGQAGGYHGVILASQTPEGMSGTLSASTGDSLQVRQAKVSLTRTGN